MLFEKGSGNTLMGKHVEHWCIYTVNLEKGWRNQAQTWMEMMKSGVPEEIFKDKYLVYLHTVLNIRQERSITGGKKEVFREFHRL